MHKFALDIYVKNNNETAHFKKINNHRNTDNIFYFEPSGVQSSIP